MMCVFRLVHRMGILLPLLLITGCGTGDVFHPFPIEDPAPDVPTDDPDPGPGPMDPPEMESEPNDSAPVAKPLPDGGVGAGSVFFAGDVDYWSFDAVAGEVIRVELYATRHDQATWGLFGNVPRLSLVDPDGATVLLTHDASGVSGAQWDYGRHDLDIPAFPIKQDGTYYLSVTQDDQSLAGGDYVLTLQKLDLGVLQQEQEALGESGVNDALEDAQPIQAGAVCGFHVAGERDAYAITISEPTLLYAEVTAYRNGRYREEPDYFDPELFLLGPGGEFVQANDDAYFSDSALTQKITTPGTYYLVVDEFAALASAPYLLSVTSTPLQGVDEGESNDTSATAAPIAYGELALGDCSADDEDWYVFDAAAGDLVQLGVFDRGNEQGASTDVQVTFWNPDGLTLLRSSAAVEALSVARTLTLTTGAHYIRVRSAVPTTYALQLRRLEAARFEDLENDTPALADPLDDQGRAAGEISDPGDVDTFRFEATAGAMVRIRVFAERGSKSDGFSPLSEHGSDLEPLIHVLDSSLTEIASVSYDGPETGGTSAEGIADGLPTLSLVFLAPQSGEYFVRVQDQAGGFGKGYHYLIKVE